MKRITADILIRLLRICRSTDWKLAVISWGYGRQGNNAW